MSMARERYRPFPAFASKTTTDTPTHAPTSPRKFTHRKEKWEMERCSTSAHMENKDHMQMPLGRQSCCFPKHPSSSIL